jgi:hypothetical protein
MALISGLPPALIISVSDMHVFIADPDKKYLEHYKQNSNDLLEI